MQISSMSKKHHCGNFIIGAILHVINLDILYVVSNIKYIIYYNIKIHSSNSFFLNGNENDFVQTLILTNLYLWVMYLKIGRNKGIPNSLPPNTILSKIQIQDLQHSR